MIINVNGQLYFTGELIFRFSILVHLKLYLVSPQLDNCTIITLVKVTSRKCDPDLGIHTEM